MKLMHKFAEMTPEKRPQDPHMDGRAYCLRNDEHGGEYPDTMPQAIKLLDADGRSCTTCRFRRTVRSSTAKGLCSIRRTTEWKLPRAW